MSDLLEVKLSNYEGPLDLLVHLIYKNELNIFDIPISFIAEKFIEEIRSMKEMDIEIAADFIQMATYLIYLKSRMLLPRDTGGEEDMDPEEEKFLFTQKLIEYSFYRDMAAILRTRADESSRHFVRTDMIRIPRGEQMGDDIFRLAKLYFEAITEERAPKMVVKQDEVDFPTLIARVKGYLLEREETLWSDLVKRSLSRKETAVSLVAVLELCRLKLVTAHQEENFAEILIRKLQEERAG